MKKIFLFLLISIFFFIGMNVATAKKFDLSYYSRDFDIDVPEWVDFCTMQYNRHFDGYVARGIYVQCYEGEIYFEFGKGIVFEIKDYGNYIYMNGTWSGPVKYQFSSYTTYENYCKYNDNYLYLECINLANNKYSDVLLALSIDIKYKNSNDIYLSKDSYEPVYNVPGFDYDYSDEYIKEEVNLITNVYSVDFYLETDVDYMNKNFKIKMQKNDVSNIFGEAFKFYGLVNDSGLYHWEELLASDTGCAVDDYIESYSSNEYFFEVKGLTSECSNLFNNYEKILFKVQFANSYSLDKITVNSPVEDFYINTYSYMHIIQKFNTSDFKYINFTTTLSQWSSEYDFNIKYFEKMNKDVFIDLFDIKTKKFKEYLVPNDFDEIEIYNNKRYYINFGQSTNTGFWITYNIPTKPKDIENFIDFDFTFSYVPNDLYYSINLRDGTKENNNAVIVDENGNPQIVDIEPDYLPSSNNSFGINYFARGIDMAHLLYSTFYSSLSLEFKILHNIFFTLLIVAVVVKVVLK